jgi:hypothetical protein
MKSSSASSSVRAKNVRRADGAEALANMLNRKEKALLD